MRSNARSTDDDTNGAFVLEEDDTAAAFVELQQGMSTCRNRDVVDVASHTRFENVEPVDMAPNLGTYIF